MLAIIGPHQINLLMIRLAVYCQVSPLRPAALISLPSPLFCLSSFPPYLCPIDVSPHQVEILAVE